jgi:hypothetical protein
LRSASLLLCLGCAPSQPALKSAGLDTAETLGSPSWDTGPQVHTEESSPAPARWGCSRGPTAATDELEPPRDHSEGHLYRVVEVQTEAFDLFYVTVFFPPKTYRSLYEAGAPVVLTSMQSIGIGRSWVDEPRSYFPIELGVVEVQPLHPGWNTVGMGTPGLHDGSGPQTAASLAAAADFALGRTTTAQGHTLRDLVNREVCTGQIAILGASSGGITAATALRDHADTLRGRLVGMSFYETPSLPLFVVGDTGSKALDRWPTEDTDGSGAAWDEGRNPEFLGCDLDTLSCDLDLRTLAWAPEVTPADVANTEVKAGAPGLLYLDRNRNGLLDLSPDNHPDTNGNGLIDLDEDFYLMPYQDLTTGDVERQLHSPRVATAAATLFGEAGPPAHLAVASEAIAFWEARNAVLAVREAVERHDPDVRYAVTFSEEDHSVPVRDHPHVAVLYAALSQAGAKVRTNLDREAAVCLAGETRLVGWDGGSELGADWELDSLTDTALPTTLPAVTARAIATLGLFWDSWGRFDHCPVSTR